MFCSKVKALWLQLLFLYFFTVIVDLKKLSVGGSRNASLRALALSTRHRLDLALSRAGKFSVLKHGILELT